MTEKLDPIVALKTTFLRQQVRILSQPLRPSERWKSGSDLPEENVGISVKRGLFTFFEMLRQLLICPANEIVRRHNNSVYDGVAIRNVARQIDELYWQSTNPEDPLYGEEEDEVVMQGDDLTTDE
jgi:hypothetical protein